MSTTEKGLDRAEKTNSARSDLKNSLSEPELKRTQNQTILSPQPSDDPKDPLNWPRSKKIAILAVLSVTSSAALGSPLAGLLALTPQAETYGKSVSQVSYGTSIALAGMVVGPFALLPLSHAIGRTSIIFWSTLLVLVCNTWAACMTNPSQYAPYLVSRFFAGFGAPVPSTLGPRILLDLFFIHERGRAFSVLTLSYLLGTLAIPTIGCFVASQTDWPIMFWWTIPFLGLALILTVVFMEETGFEREGKKRYPRQPTSFVANRIATFLPGNKVVPSYTLAETVHIFTNCLILMVTPVSLAIGLYGLISYGAALMQATMQATFLLEPVKTGGYGFELIQLAEVSISGWIGILAAFVYTQVVSDRVPMRICRKHGGIWKNEYRLQCMWFPGLIVLPIGLGIFGVSVKRHWNPAMLALSYFMTMFGANAATSIISNYLSESFPQFPAECGIFLSAYRLVLGFASGFFIQPWAEKVGVAWTFGTAALLSVFAFSFIIILLWKGPAIRRIKFTSTFNSSDEGSELML